MWPLLGLTLSALALTSCAITVEYGSRTEAQEAADGRSKALARIQTLEADYETLWNDGDELEAWKRTAIPVFKETGVTTADLYRRATVSSSVTGSADDDRAEIQYLEKSLYQGMSPQPKPGEVSAGLYQIPGRFELVSPGNGGSVRTSRGRCTVKGIPTTIHAYDFFGPDRDFFLRCEFWVPETP